MSEQPVSERASEVIHLHCDNGLPVSVAAALGMLIGKAFPSSMITGSVGGSAMGVRIYRDEVEDWLEANDG